MLQQYNSPCSAVPYTHNFTATAYPPSFASNILVANSAAIQSGEMSSRLIQPTGTAAGPHYIAYAIRVDSEPGKLRFKDLVCGLAFQFQASTASGLGVYLFRYEGAMPADGVLLLGNCSHVHPVPITHAYSASSVMISGETANSFDGFPVSPGEPVFFGIMIRKETDTVISSGHFTIRANVQERWPFNPNKA